MFSGLPTLKTQFNIASRLVTDPNPRHSGRTGGTGEEKLPKMSNNSSASGRSSGSWLKHVESIGKPLVLLGLNVFLLDLIQNFYMQNTGHVVVLFGSRCHLSILRFHHDRFQTTCTCKKNTCNVWMKTRSNKRSGRTCESSQFLYVFMVLSRSLGIKYWGP